MGNFSSSWLPAEATVDIGGELTHVKFPSALQLWAALRHYATDENSLFLRPLSLFKPIRYVVDVGANVGATATVFHLAFPEAIIYAIEPVTINYECLEYNTRTIPNIICDKRGAYDKQCQLAMSLPTVEQRPDIKTRNGNSGLFSLYGKDKEEQEIVDVDRLDDMVDRPVDLLKIDVEGAEHLVLAGSKRILEEDRPLIIMEVRAGNMDMAGVGWKQYLDLFRDAGYRGIANYLGDVVLLPEELLGNYAKWKEQADKIGPEKRAASDFPFAFSPDGGLPCG